MLRLLLGMAREERRILIWCGCLWVAAGVTAAALVAHGFEIPHIWILVGLAIIAGVAERQSVGLLGVRDDGIEISVSFLPFVFTAVAFGPLAALIVGAAANLTDFRRPYLRWAVYTPVRALTGAIAGLAVIVVEPVGGSLFVSTLAAALVAALANLTADAVFNIATLVVRGSRTAKLYLRTMGPFFFVAVPLYVPVIAFLAYGYREYSIAVVATFLVPAIALQRVIHLYQEQRDAVRDLGEANRHLEHANLSFATALVTTLDARDEYTAGHSAAIAIYARDIAKRMNLSPDQQQLAHLCGLVHDIGKIGLPAGLLEKPGPLTLDERRQMQLHSEIGERILAKVDDYAEIARIARHHHERADGNGYPDGLSDSEIPLISRIITVADAYNAMTSDRPYRDAMPTRVARLRLAQAVETQFDTSVVAAFEAILAGADEDYRLARRKDFVLSDQVADHSSEMPFSEASGAA